MSPPNGEIEFKRQALLPAGVRDLLPPDAAHEAAAVQTLISTCEAHGYERVKPPLIEFEESLFSGPGVTTNENTFRLMDPVSRRMMGLRADVTVQIARIAATRLNHCARPLRLCYSGEVLRVTPESLNPERELVQVGAELVGPDSVAADVEVILLAIDALRSVGTKNMSIDITVPGLVPNLLKSVGVTMEEAQKLRIAIDRKDVVQVTKLASSGAPELEKLMMATGAWKPGLEQLRNLRCSDEARRIIDRLGAVTELIASEKPDFQITIDPVENRGFEYYTGLGFSLFSKGIRGELGRGGRYQIDGLNSEGSCGFTLYMETVIRSLIELVLKRRVYLPYGTERHVAENLRGLGWSTIFGLGEIREATGEAERLNCTHVLQNGKPIKI